MVGLATCLHLPNFGVQGEKGGDFSVIFPKNTTRTLCGEKPFWIKKKTNYKVKNKVKIKVYKIKEEKGTIGFNPWYDWICSKKS